MLFVIFRSCLRSHVCLPVAAGVLLVGLPYSISLAAQWLYGWPNKPGYKKYTEALKPRYTAHCTLKRYCKQSDHHHFNVGTVFFITHRRIYCLARAILESLKYLQYGRLYFRWKSWYKDLDNSKHYEKVN